MIPDHLTLRDGTKDLESAKQVFIQEMFEPLSNFKDVKLIVDLGAYIGLVSYYFATKYPDALVIAFEPDHESYERACVNCSENPNSSNITIYNLALWPRPARLSLIRCERTWATSATEATGKWQVTGITMNQVVAVCDQTIDILKIDIEGAQKYLFAENVEWLNSVRNLCIELHDEQDKEVFWECMKKYSYDLIFHGELVILKNIERQK